MIHIPKNLTSSDMIYSLSERKSVQKKEYMRLYRKRNRQKYLEYNRKWREEHPEYMVAYREVHAEKLKADNKERAHQYRKHNRDMLRERQHKYYEENSEAIKEQKRKYRQENPEKVREYERAQSQKRRDANRDEIRAYHRKYRSDNREKLREKYREYYRVNKEAIAIYQQAWAVANHDKVRATGQRRRARKLNTESTLTEEEWQKILDDHFHCCHYCGKKSDRLHQEHKIPVVKGGGYTKQNIVPACPKCNHSKGAKSYDKFVKESSNRLQTKLF